MSTGVAMRSDQTVSVARLCRAKRPQTQPQAQGEQQPTTERSQHPRESGRSGDSRTPRSAEGSFKRCSGAQHWARGGSLPGAAGSCRQPTDQATLKLAPKRSHPYPRAGGGGGFMILLLCVPAKVSSAKSPRAQKVGALISRLGWGLRTGSTKSTFGGA